MQIGICGLLTIIFVIAKIFGFLDWSWLWVLAPVWIGALLVIGLAALAGLLAVWFEK